MSHVELLVPFALPPAELAPDLLRELALPAMAMLLGRGSLIPGTDGQMDAQTDAANGFARALPHETWLARRFGLEQPAVSGSSPPVAAALMRSMQREVAAGFWFIVQPVHFHIARDHLVLTDPRQLHLSETDARALFAAALPSFEEAGLTLVYGRADCWFMRADDHRDLQTATPDAACGHNIDIWMPQGASARAWRKLQNIVQMDWHAHDVNQTRAAAGQVPVNSVWAWGGADAASTLPAPTGDAVAFRLDGWCAAFAASAGRGDRQRGQVNTTTSVKMNLDADTDNADADADASAVLQSNAPRRLVLLDALIGPALGSDWSQWLAEFGRLEADWFAPLLAALRDGRIDSLTLILTHATGVRHWSVSRLSLKKFWRKPALAGLLP